MYKKILAAIDLTPNENAVLEHTRQLAHLPSATVHLLHVAPVHVIPGEIIGGSGLGVVSGDDDVAPDDRRMIKEAVDHFTSAGGVTATDTAGFPVTIAASGSYRLTGNLVVTDKNTTVIEVTNPAKQVTIDLNGFSISGPVTCAAPPIGC